jgi:hypothetical protein
MLLFTGLSSFGFSGEQAIYLLLLIAFQVELARGMCSNIWCFAACLMSVTWLHFLVKDYAVPLVRRLGSFDGDRFGPAL